MVEAAHAREVRTPQAVEAAAAVEEAAVAAAVGAAGPDGNLLCRYGVITLS